MDTPSPFTNNNNNNTDMRHDKRERDGVEREQKYITQLFVIMRTELSLNEGKSLSFD